MTGKKKQGEGGIKKKIRKIVATTPYAIAS